MTNTTPLVTAPGSAPETGIAAETGIPAETGIAAQAGIAGEAETVRRLRVDLDCVAAERDHLSDRLRQATERHRADIALIGERLTTEAQDRGWCDTYDSIIDELNASLTVELPAREKTYTVTATVRVEMTVEASDPDGARSAASTIVDDLERLLDGEANVTSYWGWHQGFEVEED